MARCPALAPSRAGGMTSTGNSDVRSCFQDKTAGGFYTPWRVIVRREAPCTMRDTAQKTPPVSRRGLLFQK